MQNYKWWEDAIIYQIYPRSFNDTNNDGIGDLNGIIEKLDYIKSLGVNTLWLNPVVSSNQIDNGYDVTNYKTIDPLFGTEEDFGNFVTEAKKRHFKLIYDLPLNHTSMNHKWFKGALEGKDNYYRDFYIWKDSPEDGFYPNNWTAAFGGAAWSKELNGDQYYMHIFKKEMPELNWDHEPVRKNMAEVINYWVNRGIDGIRLDAFIYLDVDKDFPDQTEEQDSAQEVIQYGKKLKKYISDFNDNIFKNEKNLFLMGEATSADAERSAHYTDHEVLDRVISLQHFTDDDKEKIDELPSGHQHAPLDLKAFKETQKQFQEKLASTGGPMLFWNNHDRPRSPQKYGDTERFRDGTAKMMATLLYLQRGIPIIYYGEEIGMNNAWFKDPTNIPETTAMDFYEKAEQFGWEHDEIMKNLNLTIRDSSRGIMQWTGEDRVGFSETAAPWIIYHKENKYNVEDQEKQPDSILNYYRKLIDLKKQELFTEGDWKLLDTEDTLYVYEREYDDQKALVCCNFSAEQNDYTVDDHFSEKEIVLSTEEVKMKGQSIVLPPYSAYVFLTV